MWQRIQTVYLLIAMALNALLFQFELAVFKLDEGIEHLFNISGLSIDSTTDSLYTAYSLVSLVSLSMFTSLVIILMFKKRQLQIKLAQLNLFIQAALVVAIFFFIEDATGVLNNFESVQIDYGLGTYLSLLPLLFIYLAVRKIKKDEALVRAADRIR